ncbi:MAG: PAS domain S-box protein [Candidatus Thermoplasmatota archaeon]|nr:PAS domain S-box protein [Candidatus Thermoplasmatota archaeon]
MVEHIEKIEDQNSFNISVNEKRLILGIDKDGRITRFNDECEKLAGFSQAELLNKDLSSVLLLSPDQFENFFKFTDQNKPINDFEIPMLIQNGDTIPVSWSSFPIKDPIAGTVKKVSLVGKPIFTKEPFEKYFSELKDLKNRVKVEDTSKKSADKNKVLFSLGGKRLVLKRKTKSKLKKTDEKKEKSQDEKIKVRVKKKNIAEQNLELKKIIKSLQKKNNFLLAEKNKLEKKLKKINPSNDEIDAKEIIKYFRNAPYYYHKVLNFLLDGIGISQKREEFRRMSEETKIKKSEMELLESEINKYKKEFNKKLEEMREWRRKLEIAENEINRRRKDLVEQESMFSDLLFSSIDSAFDSKILKDDSLNSEDYSKNSYEKSENIFDHIKEPAAIIQRGKLKKVNNSFASLVGYEVEELNNKSLVSIVSDESYPIIEQYYLDRLKGNETASYKTTFITKDQEKIDVIVHSKPTTYQGEKAEITILNNSKILENIEK